MVSAASFMHKSSRKKRKYQEKDFFFCLFVLLTFLRCSITCNVVKALAMFCLRPCHYHTSVNACDASRTSATSQQVLMCSKDAELHNAELF